MNFFNGAARRIDSWIMIHEVDWISVTLLGTHARTCSFYDTSAENRHCRCVGRTSMAAVRMSHTNRFGAKLCHPNRAGKEI
jgi:hypothetical protein